MMLVREGQRTLLAEEKQKASQTPVRKREMNASRHEALLRFSLSFFGLFPYLIIYLFLPQTVAIESGRGSRGASR
jgi:hypothetical protein